MKFLRRLRPKPPIQVNNAPALFPVTVEVSGSWTVSYTGNVQEQRMGPSYRWTPRLTSNNRQALMHVLNHNVDGVKVSGGTAVSILLHASGKISNLALDQLRTFIESAEEMSIAEAHPVAV